MARGRNTRKALVIHGQIEMIFGDSIDFVGWYCNLSSKKCGISKGNARNLYLAYHEGRGGFNRKTYRNKGWLLKVANKVQRRANKYKSQLASCEGEFRKGGGVLSLAFFEEGRSKCKGI